MKEPYQVQANIVGVMIILMVLVIFLFLGTMLQSCTYTIQNTISTGSEDVVDSTPNTSPTISPNVSMPLGI